MNKVNHNPLENLDLEWVQLVKDAKELGLTVEEIRRFLSGG